MPPSAATIGFLTTSFPRFQGDVAGSFVFGMARALARRGHRIEVLAPEPPLAADWQGDAPWLSGIRVHPVSYVRPAGLQTLFYGAGAPDNVSRAPLRALLSVPASVALGAATRRRSSVWQAVVSHWLLPSSVVVAAARKGKPRLRHLAIAHSGDVHLLNRLPIRGFLLSRILDGADHLGFVTASLRREFLGMVDGARREIARRCSSVTPMGVELGELETGKSRGPLRKALRLEGFTVLFLGRLVPIKGVDLLIQAVAGMDGVTLLVAGEGPERERLERQAASSGNRIRFLGAVGPGRRAELLAAADAVALPSRVMEGGRHEGLPLTLVEALSTGCPVVVSRTGGMAELVSDPRMGRTVAPGDAEALRDAVSALKKEASCLFQTADFRKAAVADRDWNRLAPMFEDLLLA